MHAFCTCRNIKKRQHHNNITHYYSCPSVVNCLTWVVSWHLLNCIISNELLQKMGRQNSMNSIFCCCRFEVSGQCFEGMMKTSHHLLICCLLSFTFAFVFINHIFLSLCLSVRELLEQGESAVKELSHQTHYSQQMSTTAGKQLIEASDLV